MKIQTRTLERVLRYLDKQLELPLSLDDALYYRWKLHSDIFHRNYEQMKEQLFKEWSKKYTIRFHDGYYEEGQLVKKINE